MHNMIFLVINHLVYMFALQHYIAKVCSGVVQLTNRIVYKIKSQRNLFITKTASTIVLALE